MSDIVNVFYKANDHWIQPKVHDATGAVVFSKRLNSKVVA